MCFATFSFDYLVEGKLLARFFFDILDVLYLNVFIIIFQLSKLHEALHVVL